MYIVFNKVISITLSKIILVKTMNISNKKLTILQCENTFSLNILNINLISTAVKLSTLTSGLFPLYPVKIYEGIIYCRN